MGKKRKVGEPIKDLGIVGFSLFWIFNLKKNPNGFSWISSLDFLGIQTSGLRLSDD